MLKKTPLHAAHLAAGAKMLDFHGWDMPLHYGSQLKEHEAVRHTAGMFDVSHMTIIDVLGAGARQFLRKLLTNDVDGLKHVGCALYTCLCNEHGGILDDLIVYHRTADNYRLVFNAATREHVLPWIQDKSAGFAVGLQERSELAILAVQGPKAIEKVLSVLGPAEADAVSTLTRFECVDVGDYFFARTGYTGEDGLEIILPQDKITSLWHDLYNQAVAPTGLAARDTLRLEAGFLLYGQDMDDSMTPLNSGLGWTIRWKPHDRHFIGMEALLAQKQDGIKRKLVGLTLKTPGIMRPGQAVFLNDQNVGVITSGTYSPTLKHSVAIARVLTDVEAEATVEIRGKQTAVTVGTTRFLTQSE
jgi:aminomethyltransferase